MRLISVKMVGFKSFPTASTLRFEGNCIALVGPNGCGKSNIVDAIRFALGEQSAKALRAEKLVDLIFGGNEYRKSASFTEVSLTFELSEAQASLSTVVITRKLYRDGGSEYLINNRAIRLKDLEQFLRAHHLPSRSFYLFEQGKLDEIMRLSPQARRSIFDETAGICQFMEQKKLCEQKLAPLASEVMRLQAEYESGKMVIERLEKEAQVAALFLEKKKRAQQLGETIYLHRYAQANRVMEQIQEKIVSCANEIQIHEEKLRECEKDFAQVFLEQKREQDEINVSEKQQADLETAYRLLEVHVKHLVQKIGDLKKNLEELQREQSQEKQLELVQSALKKELMVKIETLEKQKGDFVFEDRTTSLFEEQREFYLQAKEKYAATLVQLKESQALLSHHERQEQQLREAQLAKQKAMQLQEGERAHLQQQILQKKQLKEELQKQIRQSERAITDQKQFIEQLEAASVFKAQQVENLKIELTVKVAQLSPSESGAKKLFDATQHQEHPLFGKLSFYEGAAELYRAPFNEMLRVKRADLAAVIEMAKKMQITHLWFELHERARSWEKEIRRVSLEEFEAVEDEECLVGEELFFDRNGLLYFAGTKAKIREDELKKLKTLLETSENEFSDLQAQKNKEKKTAEERSAILRASEMKHVEINFQLQTLQAELVKCDQQMQKMDAEEKAMQKQLNQTEALFDQLREDVRISLQNEADEKEMVRQRLLQFESCKPALDEMQQKQKEHREIVVELARQQERLNALLNDEKRVSESGLYREQKLSQIEEQLRSFELEMKSTQEKKEQKLVLKQEQIETNAKRFEAAALCKRRLDQLNEKRQTLAAEQQKKRAAKEDFERKKIAIQSRLQQLHDELVRYNVDISKAAHIDVIGDIEGWQKEHDSLVAELQNVSQLNVGAIDIVARERERFNYLHKQLSDIVRAKEDLGQIIAKLEEQCRSQFMGTFEAARSSFDKLFKQLFGGGRCDLVLVGEQSDVLTKGVEIVAELPGQKMKSLSLMSGGQRCLAALALLFALFEIKPAPLCLMDEIDAPLDEANVDRFAELLSSFAATTEFIVVTHNKKTMGVADLLIGVSMEEKGVSTWIPLQLAAAAR